MATDAKPHPIEAALWYAALDASGKVGRWTYFRRYASTQPGDAERRVEADFKECGDGRLEAENSGLWGFSGMITVLRPRLDA